MRSSRFLTFFIPFFTAQLVWVSVASSQTGSGGGRGAAQGRNGGQAAVNMGKFYGKIMDEKNGKSIVAATIQCIPQSNRNTDTASKKKATNIKTVLSESNGDFTIENLNMFAKYSIKISAIGYKTTELNVAFDIKPGSASDPNFFQTISLYSDKDLGNIKLKVDATQLQDVTVTATAKPIFEMGIDRKIFNVDKNLVTAGQTATELMKSVPTLQVDIDGNVTLRNATPTLFVDGRPTTLTLDQIPADIIDKVEIITNPSAKYDASGGNAGILNIVLKKNRKNGYNGNVRWGIDSRYKWNAGADINVRQNKINAFLSANYNQRKSIPYNYAERRVSINNDAINTISRDSAINEGSFMFIRGGLDYLMDIRNTLTFAVSYHKGQFDNEDPQFIDTTTSTFKRSVNRLANTQTVFENTGVQLSFRHNFFKPSHNISFDVNYNAAVPRNQLDINTVSAFNTSTLSSSTKSKNNFFTFQGDYENQLNENQKIEAGIRTAIREFETKNLQSINNNFSTNLSSNYKFVDMVHAAYATYTLKRGKWNYQLGLRLESSNYKGNLLTLAGADTANPISVQYPLSLFPSAFITYKISDKQDIQINYSRRVNRPSFFQLLPVYNFSDPQNPSIGNTGLQPEFTNSFEFSYNNVYTKGANLLATVYFKQATNLLTQYVYKDYNRLTGVKGDSLYYMSYLNANDNLSYGLELTNKITLFKIWDFTTNVNLFYAQLNATIPNQASVSNSMVSWFGKVNNNIKLGKGWSVQISAEFTSKALLPRNNGGGWMRGGPMGNPNQNVAQGYVMPRYGDVDVAIKKEWTWKSGESFSLI